MNRNAIILGAELAAARVAEQARLASGGHGSSRLSGMAYDREGDELNLTAVVHVPLDLEVQALLIDWRKCAAAERERARRILSMEDNYTLIQFARRMAVQALNQSSPAPYEQGLLALAMIDECRIDARDALWAAGLLDHSTSAWPDQAAELLNQAITVATPGMGKLLEQSVGSTLEDWGYRERRTSGGIGLIRSGWARYNPAIDLADLAVRVGTRVLASRYIVEIEVATDLPAVWFDRPKRQHAEETLERSLGVAAIRGTLRSAFGDCESQMFVTWIAEMPSQDDCDQLVADVGDGAAHEGRYAVGVAAGCLFALLVAGSCQQRVEPYESLSAVTDLAEQTRMVLSQPSVSSSE